MFLKHLMFSVLVLSSPLFYSCAHETTSKGLHRPFRAGMMKFSPLKEEQKPLAPVDFSGWVEGLGRLIGSPDSQSVIAFSLDNRTVLWRKTLKAELSAPAFPVGDFVILAQQDGTLSKLDFRTGEKIWDLSLASFVPTQLTRDNERVFAVTATQVLYAININDGKVEWFVDAELPNEIRIHNSAPPFIYVNHLFWGLPNGDLVGIEIKSGKKLWRKNPRISGGGRFHNYMGTMAVSNASHKGLVFCRYDGLIGSVSLEAGREGELLWQLEGNTGNCTDSDTRSGRFYAVTSSGEVFSMNTDTGKSLWAPIKLGKDLSSITAIEEFVFVTGADGNVYALSPSGELQWYDKLDARLMSHPIFAGDKMYVPTGLKNIYAYKI